MTTMQDWMALVQFLEPLGKWAAFAVAFVGLARFCIWPLWRLVRAVDATTHKLADAIPVLLATADQFKNNGGGSLKDAIDRIEDSLALSNQRHRAICSYLDVALFETDAIGNYTFVSKDWCILTGLAPEQALGQGWILSVQADHRDQVMTAWKRSIEEKREFALEYDIYSPSGHGHTVKVSSRAFPSRRGAGKFEVVIGVIGILRKIDTVIHTETSTDTHTHTESRS